MDFGAWSTFVVTMPPLRVWPSLDDIVIQLELDSRFSRRSFESDASAPIYVYLQGSVGLTLLTPWVVQSSYGCFFGRSWVDRDME